MSDLMHVTILDAMTLKPISSFQTSKWSIAVDVLDYSESTFETQDQVEWKTGDLLIAKSSTLTDERASARPAYIGVVREFKNQQIVSGYIYDLLRGEVMLRDATYPDLAARLVTMLAVGPGLDQGYLTSKTTGISMDFVSRISRTGPTMPITFKSADGFADYKDLKDWMTDLFRSYGLVWRFSSIELAADNQSYHINSLIGADPASSALKIKDNSPSFLNWQIHVSPKHQDAVNEVIWWWKIPNGDPAYGGAAADLLKDGSIVWQDGSDWDVSKFDLPGRWIYQKAPYEQSWDDMLAATRSLVSASNNSHEIELDLAESDDFIDRSDVYVGRKVDLTFQGKLYPSIISGISASSDSSYLHIKLGNIRSSMRTLLNRRRP